MHGDIIEVYFFFFLVLLLDLISMVLFTQGLGFYPRPAPCWSYRTGKLSFTLFLSRSIISTVSIQSTFKMTTISVDQEITVHNWTVDPRKYTTSQPRDRFLIPISLHLELLCPHAAYTGPHADATRPYPSREQLKWAPDCGSSE